MTASGAATTSTRPARDAATTQYETLRAMIVGGELPPGAELREMELTQRLGVSRTPVREALARLVESGLIIRDVRGYVVRRRTPEEILEIYDVRIILESACAASAARHAGEYDLSRLTHLTAQGAAVTDYDQQLALNAEWHTALRDAAHNATMAHLLEQLSTLQQIYNPHMRVSSNEHRHAGQHDHVRILEAIQAGQPDIAASVMTEHLTRVRDRRVAAFLATSHHRHQPVHTSAPNRG